LQDFHLYYLLRFGYRPSRVAYLTLRAWGDRDRGSWPDLVPPEGRNQYDLATIKGWLRVFLTGSSTRASSSARPCPTAPRSARAGSLSPRGDWRAPSDVSARAWLDELERNVPG
jgi:NAD+ synthase (glutamine-hydrolysing)